MACYKQAAYASCPEPPNFHFDLNVVIAFDHNPRSSYLECSIQRQHVAVGEGCMDA